MKRLELNSVQIYDKMLGKGCSKEEYHYVREVLVAFEIIKDKDVDVALLKLSDSVERYNTQIKLSHLTIVYYELTQEEYDLLKEVLL